MSCSSLYCCSKREVNKKVLKVPGIEQKVILFWSSSWNYGCNDNDMFLWYSYKWNRCLISLYLCIMIYDPILQNLKQIHHSLYSLSSSRFLMLPATNHGVLMDHFLQILLRQPETRKLGLLIACLTYYVFEYIESHS